jgi:misacylated tRNA(Ala) deacylase
LREGAATGELFLEDSYLREFDARVIRVAGREVWLEHTAFYPGGGGQPHDKGTLGVGPIQARVVDVQRRDGEIVHVTDKAIPETVGHLVGELDWSRRYAHMRHHTALHVLSAVLERDFGAKAAGGKIYPDRARLDFSYPAEMNEETSEEIERSANHELAKDSPVSVYELSSEEAAARPELARARESLVPEEIESVRVVEIAGIDAQTDGGTHVSNTAEVGEIRITSHKDRGRDNKRLEFTLA